MCIKDGSYANKYISQDKTPKTKISYIRPLTEFLITLNEVF